MSRKRLKLLEPETELGLMLVAGGKRALLTVWKWRAGDFQTFGSHERRELRSIKPKRSRPKFRAAGSIAAALKQSNPPLPSARSLPGGVPAEHGVQLVALFGLRSRAPMLSWVLVTLVLIALKQSLTMGMGSTGKAFGEERWGLLYTSLRIQFGPGSPQW